VVSAILAPFLIPPAAVAAVTPTRHLIVLWMDGTTLADWSSPALPHFHALLEDGAIALLATRTVHETADQRTMRANAAVSFGAGAEGAGEPGSRKPIKVAGVTPGLLGDALDRGGYITTFVERGTIDRNAALAFARADGSLPPPVGLFSGPGQISAALIDLGGLPMKNTDEILGAIQGGISPRDLLVVVSGTASVARQRQGIRLSVVAIQGPGFGHGLLTSGTTRRDGIIALTDLAPTIVSALGLPALSGVEGRVATVVPRAHPATFLASFERDVIRASSDRRPLTRWTLVAAMILVVIALAMVWFAGPSGRKTLRIPPGARDWLATLLVAAAATPLALYVNGAFRPSSTTVAGLETVAVALGLAVAARAVAGLSGSLIAVLGLTALVPLVDLLVGTPLGVRSPLAFQIAGGGRFYGVDDGVLGVVVGAEIFAAALLLERARDLRRTGRWVALFFAASVWLLGAPAYGSKFGAALTAIPALGVFAVLVAGKRLTLRVAAAIGAVTLAVTGLLIAVDALRSSSSQSHVARAVEGRSSVTAILSKKISAQWQITAHTIWTPAILIFAAAILVILWGRRDQVARLAEWHVLLKAALFAALVGGVAGLAFNDGGVITTAPIALFAATAFFAMLLERPSPEPLNPD